MSGVRTMVLAERRMDPALALVVREACGRAAIDCYSWNGIDRVDDLAGRAALALGVLPAGVRRIPGDLTGLVTDQLPGLPLVLVAEEPLVRPVVSLHDGLVTLLESPLTVARLTSCARGLLAERVPTSGDQREWWPLATIHADGEAVERCGYQVGPCWIGALDCAGSEEGAVRSIPWLRTDRGVAAMLAPATWLPPDGSEETGEAGSAGCMVELELTADPPRWVFHRAGPGDVVGLFSAQRLPRWTELGPRSRSHAQPIRIPAAVGDVVVLFTPAPPWVVDPAAPGHPVREGGPALLDVFEMELRRAPMPFACLVIDLR
jgi:hypothetical protein